MSIKLQERHKFRIGIGKRIVSAMLILSPATGCVDRAASQFDELPPAKARALAAKQAGSRNDLLTADLQSAFGGRTPRNILLLSGGDAHGAFGCGVLAGWRRSAVDPRPKFDIVTGVSTGALMATFAFLGEERDDADLRDVYVHIRDKDVFRGPVGGPPDALFDTAPLRKLIAAHVTADTIRRIAAEHRRGRRLYVATAELDTGALFVWPMSRLAGETVGPDAKVDPAKLERFRAILLAAASIPVLFPPVEIDGGLHVDAGLRAALILQEPMLGPATDHPAPDHGQPPTVWLIFNGPLVSTPQPVTADVMHIGLRSLELYTHSVELLSVREAAFLSVGHTPAFRFRWICQPPDDAPAPTAPGLIEPMFDPQVTSKMYRTGDEIGSRAGSWTDGPPDVDRTNSPAARK